MTWRERAGARECHSTSHQVCQQKSHVPCSGPCQGPDSGTEEFGGGMLHVTQLLNLCNDRQRLEAYFSGL